MQTPGGAAFEKDCVCTTIDVQPVKGATNGDSTAVNSCRKLSPSGDFLNATGKQFTQKLPITFHSLNSFSIQCIVYVFYDA